MTKYEQAWGKFKTVSAKWGISTCLVSGEGGYALVVSREAPHTKSIRYGQTLVTFQRRADAESNKRRLIAAREELLLGKKA